MKGRISATIRGGVEITTIDLSDPEHNHKVFVMGVKNKVV